MYSVLPTGAVYIDKCSIEPNIPIFLIVAGAVYLVGFVLMPLKYVSEKAMHTVGRILGLFSLCWFITGICMKDILCDKVKYKYKSCT